MKNAIIIHTDINILDILCEFCIVYIGTVTIKIFILKTSAE